MSARRARSGMGGALAVLALLASGGAAAAQTAVPACPGQCVFGAPLVEPFEIRSSSGVLDTSLRVELKHHCVPVWQNTGQWTCSMQSMQLRTYGYPSPFGAGSVFKLPGPTLRLRKPSAPGLLGDRLRVLLVNALPVLSNSAEHQCNPCVCTGSPQPRCCGQASFPDVWPNCFHGDNDTNLHFHGTHVSPQSPQDYVLLELRPLGSSSSGAAAHGRGTVAVGSFQYAVDALRWTQPEGTHWYHPHKHGSVALQVGGGMAGALLIEGPFDDFLQGFYEKQGASLDEKLLVVQQVHGLNFQTPTPTIPIPQPLVNGQAAPTVRMCPGEIQRWRLIGATVEGGSQITIDFNGPIDEEGALCSAAGVCARQIAMDGIQFAPENYARQPLLPQGLQQFELTPGNRADFLVRAPSSTGTYGVTYEVFGQIESSARRAAVRDLLDSTVPAATLLTVEVASGPGCPTTMTFPSQADWPAMPAYLSPINSVNRSRQLFFEMKDESGGPAGPGQLPSKFYINFNQVETRQYKPECVDITAPIGTAEEWTIRNTTAFDPFHVFHIHTNPFQVVENGPRRLSPPYVWQDSITLPSSANGQVRIRQRFEEFTGEYVLHCHFLGHEDRGMMLGVQTVCPTSADVATLYYGKPRADGGPECVPGNLIPAAPQCPVIGPELSAVPTATSSSSGRGQ